MNKTARFWIWWNGPVKLSIRPGQTLRHGSFSEDDEGWSSRWEEWTNDGEKVVSRVATDGRDCDGRLATSWEGVCPLDRLAARFFDEDGIFYPDWEQTDSRQRDYAAEAAGY